MTDTGGVVAGDTSVDLGVYLWYTLDLIDEKLELLMKKYVRGTFSGLFY